MTNTPNTSSLIPVSTQSVNGVTYDVFAIEGGKLLAVPQSQPQSLSQPQSSVIAHRPLEHEASAQPVPYAQRIDPRYIDPPLVRMDDLTRNILLALGGFMVVCIGVWLIKPTPIQPPPRYPMFTRECRSSGFMGWGETCNERREYTY